jgi:hypothetical protein
MSINSAKNVLALELEFQVDGSRLFGLGVEGLNGFEAMGDIAWKAGMGGMLTGSVTLGYPAAGNTGFTFENSTDIARFIFSPRVEGEAAMKLLSLKAAGRDDTSTLVVNLESTIVKDEAKTNVKKISKNIYDLNKDFKVNSLDLACALLYIEFAKDKQGWADYSKTIDYNGDPIYAYMCDFNDDGVVNMTDLLMLMLNYT